MEEVKIKVTMPMFEEAELERFDSNIHKIVEEYSKLMFKEKDQILTQRIIMKLEEEIRKKDAYIKYLENRTPIASKKFYGDGREELQDRIDKAIKYIEIKFFDGKYKYELLEILKGSDKE